MPNDIQAQLAALLGGGGGQAQPQQDPRIAAMQQMRAEQQGPLQPYRMMPGQTMQDQQMDTRAVQPDGRPMEPYTTPGLRGSSNIEDYANRDNKTTEDDLQMVYDQMDHMAGDDVDTNQDEWPDTPEEFKTKYGRDPATDAEVEFYYGPDDQNQATDGADDQEATTRSRNNAFDEAQFRNTMTRPSEARRRR